MGSARALGLLLLLSTVCIAWADEPGAIRLDAPVGGYASSAGQGARYLQDVRYPASSVNTPVEHPVTALIRGRIAGAPKDRHPSLLIVNGVPMPLAVDDAGRFSRPYAFARGSNGVELRSPDRARRTRAQFYDTYEEKTPVAIRVVLSWDTDGTDLDLHVVTPDGHHAFYGRRVIPNGGALDVDVTSGYGPEIVSIPAAPRGAYRVYVNYYGAGEMRDVITVAQVAVVLNEGTPHERLQTVRVPMRKPGELTAVTSFVYP